MTQGARDVLQRLADNSRAAIADGVYTDGIAGVDGMRRSRTDLAEAIMADPGSPTLITEIKFASPSLGRIRPGPAEPDGGGSPTLSDPAAIAALMVAGGARALSVLTQPYLFNGSPDYLVRVRRATDVPLLMKDIVVDTVQIDAARRVGADYVLLIQSVFDRGMAAGGGTADGFIAHAHGLGLKVLLEAHTPQEFARAQGAGADLLGINNRDLDTLAIDLATTGRILSGVRDRRTPVVSESGIHTPEDIRYLRGCGADAFLVGSSIMGCGGNGGGDGNIAGRVRRLAEAY